MYGIVDYEIFPDVLVQYFHYMSAIKNKSEKTVYEYSVDLSLFFRFILFTKKMTDEKDINENIIIKNIDREFYKTLTLADAYSFLSYCKDNRKNSATTRSRKVSSIRSFYKYLTIQKIINENPFQNLDTPKTNKCLPKYLTLDESNNLLNTVEGKNKERDYAIIMLFLNCGLRLSELVGLNYNDLKDNNTMTVFGKGAKERTIYLNDACISALKRYMDVRPKEGVIDKNALFLSNQKKRISPKTVQHLVKVFLKKAGLEGFSVHKLRHTAATLMYQYGNVDVLVLKEILGHENVGTTQIYTHIVKEQLFDAVKSNPLANINTESKIK